MAERRCVGDNDNNCSNGQWLPRTRIAQSRKKNVLEPDKCVERERLALRELDGASYKENGTLEGEGECDSRLAQSLMGLDDCAEAPITTQWRWVLRNAAEARCRKSVFGHCVLAVNKRCRQDGR